MLHSYTYAYITYIYILYIYMYIYTYKCIYMYIYKFIIRYYLSVAISKTKSRCTVGLLKKLIWKTWKTYMKATLPGLLFQQCVQSCNLSYLSKIDTHAGVFLWHLCLNFQTSYSTPTVWCMQRCIQSPAKHLKLSVLQK